MEQLNITLEQFKNRPLKILANSGTQNTQTTVTVQDITTNNLTLQTITQWLTNSTDQILAEGKYRTDPSYSMKPNKNTFWKQAFPKYNNHYQNGQPVSFELNSPNTTEKITVKISKITITLTDGTEINNTVQIILTKQLETKKKGLIIQYD